jgi:hypothetical protein
MIFSEFTVVFQSLATHQDHMATFVDQVPAQWFMIIARWFQTEHDVRQTVWGSNLLSPSKQLRDAR